MAALSEKGMQTPSSAAAPGRCRASAPLCQETICLLSCTTSGTKDVIVFLGAGGGASSPLLKNPVIQTVFGGGKELRSHGERDESQPWPCGTLNPAGVSDTALPPAPQGQR